VRVAVKDFIRFYIATSMASTSMEEVWDLSLSSHSLGSNDGNAVCDDFLLTDRRTFVVLATPNEIPHG